MSLIEATDLFGFFQVAKFGNCLGERQAGEMAIHLEKVHYSQVFIMGRGRPRFGEGGKSSMIRVRADLEEMIRWITRVEGTSSAEILDPLIRQAITDRYARLLPLIEQVRAVEEEAKRVNQVQKERVQIAEQRAKLTSSGQPGIFDGLDHIISVEDSVPHTAENNEASALKKKPKKKQ